MSHFPLLKQLEILAQHQDFPFYAPGHKRGQGISPLLVNLLGKKVFQADLPELPELDNLFAPEGVIQEAQALASETFGADQTWFLVNGSTCGVIASILATCHTGDQIILPRNAHQSAISGLILAGATPILLHPQYNSDLDLTYNITPEAVKQALEANPEAKAVLMVSPTYQGICGDIKAIAHITHQYQIPLIVDEAHGSHFHFHPDLPSSALSLGADVVIQSTHKTLGAMTQASMLHLQGNLVQRDRLSQALQLVQSTSPSYLLLASLDGARHQIATQGESLLTQTLNMSNIARQGLKNIAHITILEKDNLPQAGFQDLDLTRLTIFTHQLKMTGFELDELLTEKYHITAELPMLNHLTFMITLGNTQKDIEALIKACQEIIPVTDQDFTPLKMPSFNLPSRLKISPRDAYFAPTETLPLTQAMGKISAELICPYPPGIPLLLPGEAIAPETVNYLKQVILAGGMITGCSDRSLTHLKVIKEVKR
jgi:arginine decarboxylase